MFQHAPALMSPTRGRAARYCRRIESVRQFSKKVIEWDELSARCKKNRKVFFSSSVHCLRHALRSLAFASSVESQEELERRSRYYTTNCHGSFLLNIMECSNPGSYPWPITKTSLNNPCLSSASYIAALEPRQDSSLTTEAFIWSWRICAYSINSLDTQREWTSIAGPVRPRHIAYALSDLLECHVVSLYRRGYAWVVLLPRTRGIAAVIPIFNRGLETFRSRQSRIRERRGIVSKFQYRESDDWPNVPPQIMNWLN